MTEQPMRNKQVSYNILNDYAKSMTISVTWDDSTYLPDRGMKVFVCTW